MSPNLFERAGFWTALGGPVSAIGVGLIAWGISVTPAHNSPSEPLFGIGIAVLGLGVAALAWSLVLFVAHRYAESHPPELLDRSIPQPAEMTDEQWERNWDMQDSNILRGFLRRKEEALGRSISRLLA